MAAHRRKEESDEKFCEDVIDLRVAKEEGKVAVMLQGKYWMGDIRDELQDEDPQLLARVERINMRDMGVDFDDKDMVAFIFRHLPALKQLAFSCHRWGPRGFDADFCAQGLAQLKRLESIEMYKVHLCDSAAVHVARAFAALPHLKCVDIDGADRLDDDWGTRSERESAEKLTLKGYTAIFGAIRGRVEYLKLNLMLTHSGIGVAKQLEALASAGLKELAVSVDTWRASEEKVAQLGAEFTAMLRHFAACPSLRVLSIDTRDFVSADAAIDAFAANPHLVRLDFRFDEWSLDQFCQLLKVVYASNIVSFKENGRFSFKGQEWWRLTRLIKQFADKKGWKGYEGDLEIYNRLAVSNDVERVWGPSRYRTSDVSSDETPNARESLFEEDAKPRAGAPAARGMPPPGRPGAAVSRIPPARVGVSIPARMGAARGGMPTPPSRGAMPAPPAQRGTMPAPPARRGAMPAPPAMPQRGATSTPPARTSGLSGLAAIRAARAAPPPPVLDVGVSGNWKLKDKKSIKNELEVLEEARAGVKSKLGDEWSVVIDWAAIGEATSAREDREPGENVIQRLVSKFVSNDVDEFDSDVVDALNSLCATKCVSFSCVAEHRSRDRVQVSASANGIEIVWSADWWGHEYREPYVRDWVLSNC